MIKMALVNKIIPFSCVDGTGNRMVIFFQGCNFKCLYCHNPETINKCTSCGLCVENCPTHALSIINKKVSWNNEKCINCDKCIKTCKNLSSPKIINYTVDALFKEIEKAQYFIQGITVSGGECTLNTKFLVSLFRKVKELNLTCFVDTNGNIDLENELDLLELTDKFMLDVKSAQNNENIFLTGVSNKLVLKNLNLLLSKNKLYEVRTVIAPNLENERTINFVSKIIKNKCRYKLIKYRSHSVRNDGLKFHGTISPSDKDLNIFKNLSVDNGCVDTIIT